ALAARGSFGRLAAIDAAGRKLPEVPPDAVPVLPDENHASFVRHRQQHDGRIVAHDRQLMIAAVRQANGFDVDREDASFKNNHRHTESSTTEVTKVALLIRPGAHRAHAADRLAAGSRTPCAARRSDA